MTGFYRRSINNFFRYQDGGCLNKYFIIKNDIEQRIDAFNKYNGKNVHREWDKLYKHIITQDQELKKCYENGYISAGLDSEEIIKNFKNKCNRDRTCNNQAPPSRKPPIIKPPAQKTCKDRDGCKKEKTATDDVKSKLRFVSGATDSKISEIKNPREQGQNQADAQTSKQGSVVLQPQTITKPSGSSDGTHDKASQKIVNHHPTTFGVEETQVQQLNDSSPSGFSELDRSSSDPSSECVSGRTFDLTCTSTGKNIDTKGIQTSANSGETLNTNNPEIQDSAGKVVEGQTSDAQDVSKGISDGLNLTNRDSVSERTSDEDSLHTSTNEGGNDTGISVRVNTDGSEISNASLGDVPPRDVGTNIITSVDMPPFDRTSGSESNSAQAVHNEGNVVESTKGGSTESQDASVMGSQVQVPVHTTSCHDGVTYVQSENGNSCNAREVTESAADNHKEEGVFNEILILIQQNTDNMIKASIPIGIVLLLGLLFKYTPLWRILTKKKKKERVDINEELHSVLQEPSIMDDERSIPFSYGAFEYSTFDQNSY